MSYFGHHVLQSYNRNTLTCDLVLRVTTDQWYWHWDYGLIRGGLFYQDPNIGYNVFYHYTQPMLDFGNQWIRIHWKLGLEKQGLYIYFLLILFLYMTAKIICRSYYGMVLSWLIIVKWKRSLFFFLIYFVFVLYNTCILVSRFTLRNIPHIFRYIVHVFLVILPLPLIPTNNCSETCDTNLKCGKTYWGHRCLNSHNFINLTYILFK